jgi:hypothetical protein
MFVVMAAYAGYNYNIRMGLNGVGTDRKEGIEYLTWINMKF